MSILGAMYAAVSGLNANSNALGIISDNIANSNTVGYKDAGASFLDLVTQSGISGDYSPGGVQTATAYDIAQQGAIQSASSPTDLAISGGGFFVVNSNAAGEGGAGTTAYTRVGNFTVDANGDLKNGDGQYLQGEMLTPAQSQAIANGQSVTLSGTPISALQTINVNSVSGAAQATANVTLGANLPANSTGTPQTVTVPIYDSLGVEHDMTVTFTPTGTANQWSVSASFANAGASTATIAAGDNTVQFNPDGTLDSAATTFNAANALSISWDPSVTGAATPQNVSFNLGTNGSSSGLSQLGSSFSVSSITQDGVQLGTFSSVSVSANGVVTGNFSNGLTRPIAIVPLATFENPNGLAPADGGNYIATADSGVPLIEQAETGAAGQIQSSSLENSTVDIASEFSNLIVTQNAYQANSKVITVSDQMMQALLSIQTG
ncbi:MAG TPA: flagellar hook protein FlgE [Stellaceae bacterium]|nr:flagellar hook protein FlgE [Stellaceae bacterium]